MIEVLYKGEQVVLKVEAYPIGFSFHFTYNAGSEWAAKALWKILNEALMERVRDIRKKEYVQGLKDGRKPKREHKDWFSSWLER